MSLDNSVFSFELNESLYFDKGQEVAELRGIALEPEISIQTFNDYISIRGVIELQGEYEKIVHDEMEEEEPITDFDAIEAKRYVEKVNEDEDGLFSFSHRFPVEISVPTYRVSDLSAVTVNVESFDYELPGEDQLKLYSTICIHGINQEVEQPRFDEAVEEKVEEIEEEEVVSDVVEEEQAQVSTDREEESFEFEIKQTKDDTTLNDPNDLLGTPAPALSEELAVEQDETEDNNDGRWLYKEKTQSLSDFFGKAELEEATDPLELESESVESYVENDSTYDDVAEEREAEDPDISYLADIFRSSKEEEYIKMKLCIVQKDDTIESIAERFQVSALQLIKQNRLEDDFDVSEGQLLYIPLKSS
ncbi:stage VI sporulation protein D [Oceanobacillus bengalensis]|uniref:Stage VI sporulation protein D n=1 Tax=Oceanobacillus bengalensis TaxID=1435466 RepID=A0A494Z5X4_9BACI|nr:stage VI sporulation protein D [Oceanobacillus bengalensis]RKQ17949.1 stage VI sporulation protein D [Oceanobacillus bengalensis]